MATSFSVVLSRSCSDPRDRTLEREELAHLRVLEGGSDLPRVARMRRQAAHEPIPTRPSRLAALLAVLIVLCLLSQMLGMVFRPLESRPDATKTSELPHLRHRPH